MKPTVRSKKKIILDINTQSEDTLQKSIVAADQLNGKFTILEERVVHLKDGGEEVHFLNQEVINIPDAAINQIFKMLEITILPTDDFMDAYHGLITAGFLAYNMSLPTQYGVITGEDWELYDPSVVKESLNTEPSTPIESGEEILPPTEVAENSTETTTENNTES